MDSLNKIKVEKEQLLAEWYTLNNQLKTIKEREMALRKELFSYFFPEPTPGTNAITLEGGFTLKAVYKLDVKMDFDAFDKLLEEQDDDFNLVHKTDVVQYKPSFNEAAFKKLNEEQQDFIETVLTRKPAAPTLAIVPGKKGE